MIKFLLKKIGIVEKPTSNTVSDMLAKLSEQLDRIENEMLITSKDTYKGMTRLGTCFLVIDKSVKLLSNKLDNQKD